MAPVRMRTAVPGSTRDAGRVPRGHLTDHGQPDGCAPARAPATSALRTAKPSMALLSQGGSVSRAIASTASTRPSDSDSGQRLRAQRQHVAQDALTRLLQADERMRGHGCAA